jgi:hypothetical protein
MSQINPALKEANVLSLIKGEVGPEQERGYVYSVFCEGLAEYLAIQSCLLSDNLVLKSFGQERHQKHCNFIDEWVASQEFSLMAKIYKIEPSLWQQVLVRYFTNNLEGLRYYQYEIGHWFVCESGVELKNLETFVLSPPSKITQLVFPENGKENEKTAQ